MAGAGLGLVLADDAEIFHQRETDDGPKKITWTSLQ
jgi:hypothetical protein